MVFRVKAKICDKTKRKLTKKLDTELQTNGEFVLLTSAEFEVLLDLFNEPTIFDGSHMFEFLNFSKFIRHLTETKSIHLLQKIAIKIGEEENYLSILMENTTYKVLWTLRELVGGCLLKLSRYSGYGKLFDPDVLDLMAEEENPEMGTIIRNIFCHYKDDEMLDRCIGYMKLQSFKDYIEKVNMSGTDEHDCFEYLFNDALESGLRNNNVKTMGYFLQICADVAYAYIYEYLDYYTMEAIISERLDYVQCLEKSLGIPLLLDTVHKSSYGMDWLGEEYNFNKHDIQTLEYVVELYTDNKLKINKNAIKFMFKAYNKIDKPVCFTILATHFPLIVDPNFTPKHNTKAWKTVQSTCKKIYKDNTMLQSLHI